MKRRALLTLIALAILGAALGCQPKPCTSPVQGLVLPPRPVDRAGSLPPDASLQEITKALLLDREDRGSYGDALEAILIQLGAIPAPPPRNPPQEAPR